MRAEQLRQLFHKGSCPLQKQMAPSNSLTTERNDTPGGRQHRNWFGLALGIGAIVAVVAIIWISFFAEPARNVAGSMPTSPAPQQPVGAAPTPQDSGAAPKIDLSELVARNPGYVGPQACAPCHAKRVAEFLQTAHYHTCRFPEADRMPPAFTKGPQTYQTRYPELRFEMGKAGKEFVQTSVTVGSDGEQRTSARIDLVYGAGGKADEVYLSWRDDGSMFELPIAWMYSSNQWGAAHFDRHGGGDHARPLTVRCLECHTTWFGHVVGTENQYVREDFIAGVTCERCHGPAKKHIEFHRAHPQAQTPAEIVRPDQLSRERKIEVCTQCHGNAITHRGPALSYRPGEPLADHYRTLQVKHTEDDHVANQVEYLRQSKCFQKSDELTCVTCHDPHVPSESHAGSPSSHSCRKCHQPADCGEQSRLPEGVRDRCVECHMPKYVKMNVSFQTADDDYVPPMFRSEHRIAIHPIAQKAVLRDWYQQQQDESSREMTKRLTAELVEYWRADAEKCRSENRLMGAIAALREAERWDPSPAIKQELRAAVAVREKRDEEWGQAIQLIRTNHQPQAIERLEDILKIKPDDADAHGKLGTLYAMSGQRQLAIEHLEAVAKCDPNVPYGFGMLGWLAYLDRRPNDALEFYRQAEELEPYNAKLNFHWGLAWMQLGKLPEATERFRRALTIEPNRLDIMQSLLQVLRQQHRSAEVLEVTQRAAKLTDHKNAEVLLALAEAWDEVGNSEESVKVLRLALEAVTDNVPLTLQIRGRLESVQGKAGNKPK